MGKYMVKLATFTGFFQVTGLGLIIAAASMTVYGQGTSGTSAERGTLEEITVTARRRAESLQDTPISVSAFSAKQLETRGVLRTTDVGKYTPNVQFDSVATESGGGASTQVYIRGIGQSDHVITVEPGVGVYLDGVYIGKSVGSLLSTVDAEQIEVLRGPQGTLFGRNTIGGAISITSKRPTEEFEGGAEVTVGDYDRIDGRLFVSGPMTDTLRGRLSLSTQNRDGHVDRLAIDVSPQIAAKTGETQGNVDRMGGRLALEWDITPDLMATITADTSVIREETPGQFLLATDETPGLAGLHNNAGVSTGECAIAAGAARLSNPICYNAQYEFELDDLKTTGYGPNQSNADIRGLGLTLDWEVGNFNLKSSSAYREVEVDVDQNLSVNAYRYSTVAQEIELETFSQELQISSEAFDGRLNYMAGFYYSTEEGSQVFPVLFRDFGFDSGGLIDNESWAVFAQGTYDITDQLSLTAGVRYTDETRSFDPSLQIIHRYTDPNSIAGPIPGYVNVLDGAFGALGTQIFPGGPFKRSNDDFTPMASLSYQYTDDLMVYASFSEGFKGGGFSMRYFPAVTPPPGLTPDDVIGYADPETATSYEIGFKSELLDNKLRVNASLFYVDYEDLQVTLNVNVGGPLTVPTLANAGTATIKGAEVEIVAVPTDWLDIQASLGYMDAEYDTFTPDALANFPNADTFIFQQTPELTLHFGGTVTFFDNESGRLSLRGDYNWTDSQQKDFANDPRAFQKSYGNLDANLTYTTVDEKWLVSLGGTNLTDEIYSISTVADAESVIATASRPAEWYLRLKYNF
jgi:iron complex outermembrane receptor protein